jgi:hypothetical protein
VRHDRQPPLHRLDVPAGLVEIALLRCYDNCPHGLSIGVAARAGNRPLAPPPRLPAAERLPARRMTLTTARWLVGSPPSGAAGAPAGARRRAR